MNHVNNSSNLAKSLVLALIENPFYRAITVDASDEIQRAEMLAQYFIYSIEEGQRLGRCLFSADNQSGVAIWLLPADQQIQTHAHLDKQSFLSSVFGPRGLENYRKIVDFMEPLATSLINPSDWYLSILGVSPAGQGKGLGQTLLQPTLLEADRAGITCYVETFTPRNYKFYERVGFINAATHIEPTTAREYQIMIRKPTPRAKF